MTQHLSAPRVAVVGAGALGACIAAELSRGGAQVWLISEGGLASGASGRSLSWLNSSGAYSPAYHRLRTLGLERYRRLAEAPDVAAYLRFDGGLRWADAEGTGALRELHEHHCRVGYPSAWLQRVDVPQQAPGVDPAAVPEEGALWSPAEGWVDLPSLVARQVARLQSQGGRVVLGAGPAEVVLRGDRVAAVATAAGDTFDVDAVVLATGAAVPAALARVGVTVPDSTTPALLVRTPPLATRLRAVVNTPLVSLRPAPDGSLVMDAAWSEQQVARADDGGWRVRADTVQGLLDAASAVLDGSPRLTAASRGVGLKPVPGDGEPVLGAVPGMVGYHVAFTHSGATLALVVGELVAEGLLTGRRPGALEPFGVERFARL